MPISPSLSPFRPFRLAVLAALLLTAAAPRLAGAFGLDDVARQAEALARAPYKPPASISKTLQDLTYDQYRRIRFREPRSLWRNDGLPFRAQFFAAGRTFTQPLKVFEVVDGKARPLVLAPDAFDDEGMLPPGRGADGTIAGIRLVHPMNTQIFDEVIAFLGASYFRAIGAGQRYGLSARALAVDTTGGRGEEFPAFTTFWLERPAADAKTMTLYALIDSPRVAGAYRFVVKPGKTTTVDVSSRIWLRGPVATLGFAPLSSMFLGGENQPIPGDYRPEVHDSDGLQIEAGDGEWLWRPLINPRGTFVSSFALKSPRGFGLLQRDRRFASYEDLEAHYEKRPSVWIEPLGDWGAGRVELLQFHTPDETHDNIAAFWVPAQAPAPGTALALDWRLHWAAEDVRSPPAAYVVQTRRGQGYRGESVPAVPLQLHIDFAGPALDALPATAKVEAVVSGGNARNLRVVAYPNGAAGGWRVTVDAERINPREALELRAFLRLGDRTLSETWSYALAPE